MNRSLCHSMIDEGFSRQSFVIAFSCVLFGCVSTGDDYESAGDPVNARGHECFFESTIRGYDVLDDKNLLVSIANRGFYHVELRRSVDDLDKHWSIRFVSQAGGICNGSHVIVNHGFGRRQQVGLSSIREITPGELDLLLVHYGKQVPVANQTAEPGESYGAEVEVLD
ncbi:MAG: hypothetical protein GTO71_07565 [Woeseiaceae bacterium]|nr:hypothetical protein [Woeseiaceae bacterium]NIP20953.1 hypothetical protein [Woeseiaceae bacterium]